jgi:uncharacterized membrane protein
LIAAGVLIRFAFLGADSFWLDEAFSVSHVVNRTARELWAASPDYNHPSLYFVILLKTLEAGGVSEAVARLPSALASVFNLGLLFVLATRLGLTHATALAAVVLLALAPLDVWYAQEARMYAMVTTTGLLLAVTLTMDSWRGAVLICAALTLGLYLDFTTVPLSAGLAALWCARWWRTGHRSSALILTTAAYALAWWFARPLWAHLGEVIGRVDTVPLFVNLRDWVGLRLTPGLPAIAAMALLAIGLGGAAAAISIGLRSDRFAKRCAMAAGTAFIICTILFTIPRAYSAKQYIATGWPFVILATTWLLHERVGARLWLPIAAGISLICAAATVATPRADWRGVVAHLNALNPGPRAVVIDPAWNSIPYDYYHPKIAAAAAAPDAAGGEVCLIAQRFGRKPPTSASEAWLDAHAPLTKVVPFARLELRCYER